MDAHHVFCLLLCVFAAAAARTRKPASSSTPDCQEKGCSHDCELVGEFPLCVCPPHMALDGDGKTCNDATSFLLAMNRGLKLLREGSQEPVTVASVRARCLDYDHARHEMYVYTNDTITRYPLPQNNAESQGTIVAETETTVTSLAVDWLAGDIYFISDQQQSISVVPRDGGNPKTVLSQNDKNKVAWRHLVVDPHVRKLFWVCDEYVCSYNLETKEVKEDILSRKILPDHISLDTNQQIIYAIGRRTYSKNFKHIVATSYGNDGRTVKDVKIQQPANSTIFGFGVVGNTVYWESNHGGENLYKSDVSHADPDGEVEVSLEAELYQVVHDMKVLNKNVQAVRI